MNNNLLNSLINLLRTICDDPNYSYEKLISDFEKMGCNFPDNYDPKHLLEETPDLDAALDRDREKQKTN